MSKTIEQIREELDAKIPREVVSLREGGNGKSLSYLASWYVIDRLNKVFGQGNWSYQLLELTKTFEGIVKNYKNESINYVSYIAKVCLNVKFSEPGKESYSTGWSEFVDVGFGDGQDKSNPGKAHELAVKEATTDGIKRCAKSLGMSMGLALYDKAQENVEDAAEKTTTIISKPRITNGAVNSKTPAVEKTSKNPTGTPDKDTEANKKAIVNAATVLESKGIISKGDFKQKYIVEAFKATQLNDLSSPQIAELFATVKNTYKELNLQ